MRFASSEFSMAIIWWLGLDTSRGSCRPLCPDIALDPLGHHVVSCRRGGDIVICHNQQRDTLVDLCRSSHLGVKIEAGSGLTPDHSLSHPANVFVVRMLLTCLW